MLRALAPLLCLGHGAAAAGAGPARALRRSTALVAQREDPAGKSKVEEIHKKWDKMDKALEILFTIGCSWVHGKDVQGAVLEKVKKGEVETAEAIRGAIEEQQASNVELMKRGCGMVVAMGEKTCRQGCATRWNEMMEKRDDCDGKCEKVYDKFETNCMAHAGSLAEVYKAAQKKMEAQQKCYRTYCEDFGTVWTKSEEEQEAELDKQCGEYCTDKKVKMRCERKFNLNYDFISSGIASKCSEAKTAGTCFSDGKSEVTEEQKSCKKEGEAGCAKAASECEEKGKVGEQPREAQQACDARKKMCTEQSAKKCMDEFNKGMDDLSKKCGKEGGDEFEKCKDDKMKEAEESQVKECVGKGKPKCDEDCHGKCDIGKMKGCLKNLEQDSDPVKELCTDFWHLMHETSAVDPTTGDPIALQVQKAFLEEQRQ